MAALTEEWDSQIQIENVRLAFNETPEGILQCFAFGELNDYYLQISDQALGARIKPNHIDWKTVAWVTMS